MLENSNDPRHPREEFEFPPDFDDEELLVRACQELNSILTARLTSPARFPLSEVVGRLRAMRDVADRALVFWDAEQEKERAQQDVFRLLRAYQQQARWVLNEGQACAYDVAVRYVVFVWLFFSDLTGARSQVELLRSLGLKDKQQFNRLLIECSEKFGYRNATMREEVAVESFKEAARKRTEWEEFLHNCMSNAMRRVNEARKCLPTI